MFQKKFARNVFKESQKSSQAKDPYFSTDKKKSGKNLLVKEDKIDAHIFETMNKESRDFSQNQDLRKEIDQDNDTSYNQMNFKKSKNEKNNLETPKKYENYFSNRNSSPNKAKHVPNLHNSDPPCPQQEYYFKNRNTPKNLGISITSPGSKQYFYSKQRNSVEQSQKQLKVESTKLSNFSKQNTNFSVHKKGYNFSIPSKNDSVRRSSKAGRSPLSKTNSQQNNFNNISNTLFFCLIFLESEYYDFSRQLNDISKLTSPFDVILENEPSKSVFNDSFKLSKIHHQKDYSDPRLEKLNEIKKNCNVREDKEKVLKQTMNFLNSLKEELSDQQFFQEEKLSMCITILFSFLHL